MWYMRKNICELTSRCTAWKQSSIMRGHWNMNKGMHVSLQKWRTIYKSFQMHRHLWFFWSEQLWNKSKETNKGIFIQKTAWLKYYRIKPNNNAWSQRPKIQVIELCLKRKTFKSSKRASSKPKNIESCQRTLNEANRH